MEASEGIDFSGTERGGVYQWIEETLQRYRYSQQSKEARGVLREFLLKTTGLSVPQVTRLVGQYLHTGQVREKEYRRHHFARQYRPDDIILLAGVDEAHGCLSGPATQKILHREWKVFGRPAFARLANLSVSHLYNLRQTTTYRRRCLVMGKTTPTSVAIGERRRPRPEGRPGYIRIDTVHQPERDGEKSVYHINAVDEVTQWEVLGCVPKISEHYLIPVLRTILEQFPFRVRGFHSDNGSEYVNDPVAELLEKLRAEFTKSRPRRSNDNALVETKNGAVVRKNIGYQWLPPSHASEVHAFYQEWFNPYLNYHRPCGFATVKTDAKGKTKKVYDQYVTPYERLKSLRKAKRFLKRGVSFTELDRIAKAESDTEFACKMQKAKQELFRRCAQAGASAPVPLRAPVGGRPTPAAPTSAELPGRRRS
ncbi:MAG: DDE-type integrase/transposase/recombinase [Terriglobales bacterium]